MTRIGPRMAEVINYVKNHPGKPMLHAARFVAPNGSLKYGYRTVHRAIDSGEVVCRRGARKGTTALYPRDAS